VSITPEEAWEQESYDRLVDEILRDYSDQIIDEFFSKRIAFYYSNSPHLLDPASDAHREASALKIHSNSACVVFSSTVVEIVFRDAILGPILVGMAHDDEKGKLIAKLIISAGRTDKFIVSILKTYGMDLEEEETEFSSQSIWSEFKALREKRNGILHKGEKVSADDASKALNFSAYILNEFFPKLRDRLISKC